MRVILLVVIFLTGCEHMNLSGYDPGDMDITVNDMAGVD